MSLEQCKAAPLLEGSRFADIDIVSQQPSQAIANHRNKTLQASAPRKAAFRLLTEVHHINAKPLSLRARDFDGVM